MQILPFQKRCNHNVLEASKRMNAVGVVTPFQKSKKMASHCSFLRRLFTHPARAGLPSRGKIEPGNVHRGSRVVRGGMAASCSRGKIMPCSSDVGKPNLPTRRLRLMFPRERVHTSPSCVSRTFAPRHGSTPPAQSRGPNDSRQDQGQISERGQAITSPPGSPATTGTELHPRQGRLRLRQWADFKARQMREGSSAYLLPDRPETSTSNCPGKVSPCGYLTPGYQGLSFLSRGRGQIISHVCPPRWHKAFTLTA